MRGPARPGAPFAFGRGHRGYVALSSNHERIVDEHRRRDRTAAWEWDATKTGGRASQRPNEQFCVRGPPPTGNAYGEVASPGGFGVGTFTLTAVPEPSTWAMMLLGFAGLGIVGYRSTRKASAVPARFAAIARARRATIPFFSLADSASTS